MPYDTSSKDDEWVKIVNSTVEGAFINEKLEQMLRSAKWGQPLRSLFRWIETNEADDHQETVVDDVVRDLEEASEHLRQKSTNWLSLFRKLEDCNYGKLVLGRRGFPTRFRWRDPPLYLARTVHLSSEDHTQIPEQSNAAKQPVGREGLLVYVFPLRHNVTASVHVPEDITGEELGRLADFTRLLPGR